MRTVDFEYLLPPELIAQIPTASRDLSRLLILRRQDGSMVHETFSQILGHFKTGDVLVLNDSRVIPVRLHGNNNITGGEFELLLLEENAVNDWWAMLRPGKRARPQTQIRLKDRQGKNTEILGTVVDTNVEGHRRIHFAGTDNIFDELANLGEVPLPPYIHRASATEYSDLERYQTVYARADGSVAAPTAGLHFTTDLLNRAREGGIEVCYVTLHVGPGTFAPVKVETLSEHLMHEERFSISEETAHAVNNAKAEGRRVIAVGTTSVRVLESSASGQNGGVTSGSGRTSIFIHPPYQFKVVDALITNFHLPCSTLLMLVSAFAAPGELRGRELMLSVYREAIRLRYRFFSYGDAMLIL